MLVVYIEGWSGWYMLQVLLVVWTGWWFGWWLGLGETTCWFFTRLICIVSEPNMGHFLYRSFMHRNFAWLNRLASFGQPGTWTNTLMFANSRDSKARMREINVDSQSLEIYIYQQNVLKCPMLVPNSKIISHICSEAPSVPAASFLNGIAPEAPRMGASCQLKLFARGLGILGLQCLGSLGNFFVYIPHSTGQCSLLIGL